MLSLSVELSELDVENALIFVKPIQFLGVDESDDIACGAGSGGTTRAVEIHFGVVGQVEVDDVIDVGNVEPACGEVGRQEQLSLAVAEIVDGIFAIDLVGITDERLRADTFKAQFVDGALDIEIFIDENESALDLEPSSQTTDFIDLVAELDDGEEIIAIGDEILIDIDGDELERAEFLGSIESLLGRGGGEHEALDVWREKIFELDG